jgi:hypothetical protein
MNEIKIASSDCKIWNLQQKTFEILAAAKSGPVVIDLLHEGPCCDSIGLNQLLDQICNFLDVPTSHFVIKTSNQLSSSHYQEIRTRFVELETAKKKTYNVNLRSSLEKKFGIFIGRSNAYRLGLASYLYENFPNDVEITYHYDNQNEYHRNNFGLEQFIQDHWDHKQQVFDFLNRLPIVNEQQEYPILWNKSGFDLDASYEKIFCDIICETYPNGKTFFITEKTFRCIAMRRPFIVYGSKHFLTNLHKLVFKTFSQWWDEGYDTDPESSRYQGIVNNINWISQQSHHTIQQWWTEMQSILNHNVTVLQNLTNQQIATTEFVYDQR